MKRASRHRAGLRCWTRNGEPFWRGSVGDYRFGAITGLILVGTTLPNLNFVLCALFFVRGLEFSRSESVVQVRAQKKGKRTKYKVQNQQSEIGNVFGGPGTI